MLLETGDCVIDTNADPLPAGRMMLSCHSGQAQAVPVLVIAEQDLYLCDARACWLPTLTPLYAASLVQDEARQVGFVQVLDEARNAESGVLREIGG